MKLVNRMKMLTSTVGTGALTLGSAVDGYQTALAAGAVDGDALPYGIEDNGAWELGVGILGNGGTTLTRVVTESSNAGSALNLSGAGVVFIVARAEDLLTPDAIGTTVQPYNANTVVDAAYVHTDSNFTASEKAKLAGIEAGATADQTASEMLTAIKTVDGAGSGLDADLLDGKQLATIESEYQAYANAAAAAVVDTAPATLDTLNELAAALGDDPNFATTVTNSIATKLNSSAYTAADVLAKVKTVDGAGSGLDADLLDGQQGSYYYPASNPNGYTTNTGTVTSVATGGGLTGGTITGSGTISHADTSTQASVDNSGATFIQDVTLDTYGHVTAIGSATITPATIGAATAAQGALADSAVQPASLGSAAYTSSADYAASSHTHVKANITDFSDADYATAAQGEKADTAVQPGAIGTAAALDVGTFANNVVQLDGNAKLPAVDASQLTSVPAKIPDSGDKSTAYTLAAADAGSFITVVTGGSITVPNSVFSAGDIVSIFNNTASDVTLTVSTTTGYIAGTDGVVTTATLATRGLANVFFIDATTCVITGNVG